MQQRKLSWRNGMDIMEMVKRVVNDLQCLIVLLELQD